MNSGITRWKIVPLYSGTPCILRPLAGLVQSLVPVARPMKFATPSGALSGNSVQVSLPAVVSMIAVGCAAAAATGFFTAGLVTGLGAVCDISGSEDNKRTIRYLRMCVSLRMKNRKSIVRQPDVCCFETALPLAVPYPILGLVTVQMKAAPFQSRNSNEDRFRNLDAGLQRLVGVNDRLGQRDFLKPRLDPQIKIEIPIRRQMRRVRGQPLSRRPLAANAFQDSPGLAERFRKSGRTLQLIGTR